MAETIKKVTVSSPANIKVRVNSGVATRVQSIQYLPGNSETANNFLLKDADDIDISNNLTGRAVLTFNINTQEFVVQDVPRLEGGTF